MVWNYNDEDKFEPTEIVALSIENIPAKKAEMSIYLIDKKNSSSYEMWKKIDSPKNPKEKQIKVLEKSGKLNVFLPKNVKIANSKIVVSLKMERQAIALVTLDW